LLRNAFKLRGKHVSIQEQFPAEIENRRKQLYPVIKQAKRDGKMATMTRDNLFIDGEPQQLRPIIFDTLLTFVRLTFLLSILMLL
jgi:hypothetical protein